MTRADPTDHRIAGQGPASQWSCLVVDDEPDLAALLSFHLARYGFTTTVCRSLREAHRLLDSAGWDLVVVDVLLPDGDGRTLIKRMRHLTATARVVLTSVLTRYDLPRHDADAYLGKPFRSADVGRVLSIAGFAHPQLAY